MNPKMITLSYHFTKDRAARLEEINYVLNGDWGESILTVPEEGRDTSRHLTSTGLLVITTNDERVIITMYIPSISQFLRIFQQANQPAPKQMRRMIYSHCARAKDYRTEQAAKAA